MSDYTTPSDHQPIPPAGQPYQPTPPAGQPYQPVPQYQPIPPLTDQRRALWNVNAILSLVAAPFFTIPAIICGHVALAQIKRKGQKGRGLAIAGLVLGYAVILFWIVVIIVAGVEAATSASVPSPTHSYYEPRNPYDDPSYNP